MDALAHNRGILGQDERVHRYGSRVEGEQAHRNAHRHRLLDEGGHNARRRDGHIHAPRLIEQPLVLRVVQASNHAGDREFGLGQQGDDQVRLVVAGRGDHHVGLVHARVVQRVRRARVGEHPVRICHGRDAQLLGHVVDQGDVVSVSEQLQGDAAAHRSGSSNHNLHAHTSVLGGLANWSRSCVVSVPLIAKYS